jgi:hypothetical protein
MNRRALRLNWVAGLGLTLALPALAAAASTATQTTLAVQTHDTNGRTQANATVTVTDASGSPATGAVIFKDGTSQLAGVALDANGQATAAITLSGGAHSLRAVYAGDSTYQGSSSDASSVQAQTSGSADFTMAVSPASVSVTAGTSATVTVSVTPVNNSSLSAPMYVTLSCSGQPNESSCSSFTPSQVSILSTTTGALTSDEVISTQAEGTTRLVPPAGSHRSAHPVEWALLLPGIFGLGGLAWGARRRRWLQRIALVALVGLVSLIGTTACNSRYDYYHHGPTTTPATPSGTYTITITGQSSTGVSSITESTSLALTVK